MTWYFSYIGDLEDPDFDWNHPPESAVRNNLPRRLVPATVRDNIGVSTAWMIGQLNPAGRDAKQLDWGTWGLRMSGRELEEFFGSDHTYATAIAELDPARHYVLVAGEGG